uniref:DNA or RNA helicases of superfamily II n=1 Tax=uncultured marine thaumarchaeote SAT1000_12_G12 TaxID=1456380 RepID=A0A075I551_9ARCH|nr:DNA or RNA helicases of superfamily II [uncultured marine thaumarchaeote SAT1000_12_G12]
MCTQASTEFSHIYDQIGAVELLNLTNYYGGGRRPLDLILNDKPGTHIVITNRHHFFKWLKEDKKKEKGKRLKRFDAFKDSQYFKFIRKNTIAIIIDEAHEVTGETYQDFLAAMGFNFSGTIESRKNINTNNIVLIGLTATAYKGSGLEEQKTEGEDDPDLSDFLDFDKENDLDYFKKLNRPTKLIHKIFGGVYIPNPQENTEKSRPIPVIDIPITAHVGDSIKISGINSFDNNVQIKSYSWKIVSFHAEPFPTEQAEFYHKFSDHGTHTIILTVTNQNDISETDSSVIQILPKNKKSKISGTGSLEDNVEFYKILEKSKVLCKVIHGVIDGPHLNMKDSEIDNWRRNRLSAKDDDAITLALEYNQKICEIVSKCITTYGKKRVLLFAHTVKHSQELMLILRVKYKLTAASVDGGTNPGVRRKIVKEFIDGKIQVLCNFGVFTTGFDVPKIDTLLICREVGRNALYTQMIGRGQRGENAGGTQNLWLITSQFPKPNCQQEQKLKLGWEALASTWEKFPDEIKDDLGLGTWDYEEKYVSEPKEKESIKDTHQIKIEPIEELELECQTCHIRKKGLKDNLEFYGYDQAYTPSLVKDALKQKTFPRHCKDCRKIRNVAKKSQDEVVRYVAENHEFNPHFLIAMFFANMIKSEKHWQGRQAKLRDLVDYLEGKWYYNIPRDDFDMDHPIIRKLERDKILEIDKYLNLKFRKIIDPISMKKFYKN